MRRTRLSTPAARVPYLPRHAAPDDARDQPSRFPGEERRRRRGRLRRCSAARVGRARGRQRRGPGGGRGRARQGHPPPRDAQGDPGRARRRALRRRRDDPRAAGRRSSRPTGIQVAKHVDVRKLLESKDVDAVTIATPNHWHSLMAIWACQAGKDVYVEKPVSHNVWEGRKLVEAAAKYGRIVAGRHAVALGRGAPRAGADVPAPGKLGKILRARGFCYKRRETHRQGRRAAADPRRRRLRPLLRAGAARAAAPRAAPLRLALGLGHRQRRHRQPGRPRDGHVPLDARRGEAAAARLQHRRPLRLRRRRRDAEHADRRPTTTRPPRSSSRCAGCRAEDRRQVHGPLPRRAHRHRRSSARTATFAGGGGGGVAPRPRRQEGEVVHVRQRRRARTWRTSSRPCAAGSRRTSKAPIAGGAPLVGPVPPRQHLLPPGNGHGRAGDRRRGSPRAPTWRRRWTASRATSPPTGSTSAQAKPTLGPVLDAAARRGALREQLGVRHRRRSPTACCGTAIARRTSCPSRSEANAVGPRGSARNAAGRGRRKTS